MNDELNELDQLKMNQLKLLAFTLNSNEKTNKKVPTLFMRKQNSISLVHKHKSYINYDLAHHRN